MNKRILICLIMVAILLSTSIGYGIAQEAQPPAAGNPDAVNLASGAPWYTQYVDGAEANSAGSYPSVVLNSGGTPYISYYNDATAELWYARSVESGGNCGVDNNWLCQMVDTDGDVGRYSSIDYWKSENIVGMWKLGISYYDATNRGLKFAIYACSGPFICSWSIYTIQQASTIYQFYGQHSSFKFTSDGVPQIAYSFSYLTGNDALKYTYPVTLGGNCGLGDVLGEWQCETIDTGEGMGQYTSLDITWDDQIFIAYYDEANGDLKRAYYAGIGGNCGPADGWLCTIIDDGNGADVGQYVSFVAPKFSGDKFRIAYHDKTNGTLKIAYTVTSNSSCTAVGWQCYAVDDTLNGLAPMGISIASDESGNPIIAYQKFSSDLSPGTLHIAQSAYAMGLDGGNCGDVPPGDLWQYWQCDVIDNASGYTDEANFTSIAVNSDGLATIAYNERTTEAPSYDMLRVAYQAYSNLYLPITQKAP
jgi:hypothetical protein